MMISQTHNIISLAWCQIMRTVTHFVMILKGDVSRVGHLKSLFGVIVGNVVFNRAGIAMHQRCCFIAGSYLVFVFSPFSYLGFLP